MRTEAEWPIDMKQMTLEREYHYLLLCTENIISTKPNSTCFYHSASHITITEVDDA